MIFKLLYIYVQLCVNASRKTAVKSTKVYTVHTVPVTNCEKVKTDVSIFARPRIKNAISVRTHTDTRQSVVLQISLT